MPEKTAVLIGFVSLNDLPMKELSCEITEGDAKLACFYNFWVIPVFLREFSGDLTLRMLVELLKVSSMFFWMSLKFENTSEYLCCSWKSDG